MHLLPAASGEPLICPKCGSSANAIPGARYGASDTPLFGRVAAAIDAELHTPRLARKLLAELRDAPSRREPPEAILLRITDDLPGLGFLIVALYPKRMTSAHRVQMLHAMGIVQTLVAARLRCLEREVADLVPRHDASTPAK